MSLWQLIHPTTLLYYSTQLTHQAESKHTHRRLPTQPAAAPACLPATAILLARQRPPIEIWPRNRIVMLESHLGPGLGLPLGTAHGPYTDCTAAENLSAIPIPIVRANPANRFSHHSPVRRVLSYHAQAQPSTGHGAVVRRARRLMTALGHVRTSSGLQWATRKYYSSLSALTVWAVSVPCPLYRAALAFKSACLDLAFPTIPITVLNLVYPLPHRTSTHTVPAPLPPCPSS